jgi:uncharacterized phage protein (TIGR02218 family)
MKTAVANPAYKIHCLRIVPVAGDTVYLTDHVRDVTIGADTYQTDAGYQFTGVSSEDNMAPGVLDLSGIADIVGIGYDQIVSGLFDGARVYAFATTWRAPVVDEEPLGVAILGKTTLRDDRYTIEMMLLVDALNQAVGQSITANCQKVFGGQEFAGCKVDLAPLIVSGTLTHATSNSEFRDSARAEAADYFAEGTIAFTSGQNAGLKAIRVKVHAADGSIETHEAFHYPVAVGDAYTLTPGCRKRLEDCRDKWSNVVNFGGFSFVATTSTYTQIGGAG